MSDVQSLTRQLDEYYETDWRIEEAENDNVWAIAPDGSSFSLSHLGHGILYAEGEEEPVSDEVREMERQACILFDLERAYARLQDRYYKVLRWQK